jgi:hypothetical protein
MLNGTKGALAMNQSGKSGASVMRFSLVVAVVALMVVSFAYFAFPATHAPSPAARFTDASGNTQQWAFGGSASSSYSCSDQTCFPNGTTNGSFSLSWNYYIEWVVIYTVTNVSSSQTMIELQTALNATVTFSLSACVQNGTAPCQQESASLNLAGRETAAGFTNITTGTVNLTAPTSNPSLPALAVENAASNEAFNFSGGYSITGLSGSGSSKTVSASFDFGGQEKSQVSFSTPLGIVPVDPAPGDWWNSSAPFSASGTWSSGYSITAGGYSSEGNWTSGVIAPSGVENVTGTDLGNLTLQDNYTHPPTVVHAQEILLSFGDGVFDGADGWLLVPATLYGGAGGILGTLIAAPSHSIALVGQEPAQTTTITAGEDAYYQQGTGFIGAAASTGNTSIPIGGASGPSVSLQAGPEPVSVAQQQYGAITSSSSPASGFPFTDVILIVVVVLVVLVVIVLVVTRRRRRKAAPNAAAPSGPAPSMMATPTGGPSPQGPSPPVMPASGSPPPVPATPVCPTCGQPGTYIAQYSRYYCYNDKQYL